MGSTNGDRAGLLIDQLCTTMAGAFEPYLGVRYRRDAARTESYEFLGLDSAPRQEEFRFEGWDALNACRAFTRWTNLDGSGPAGPLAVTVRGSIHEYGSSEEPVYRPVAIDHDQDERCLIQGTVLIEGYYERAVVDLRFVGEHVRDEFYVDFMTAQEPDGSEPRLLREFRRALVEHDLARGRHVIFDRRGMRHLKPTGITWEDVVLPDELSREIRRHTVEFLRARLEGNASSLPAKRSLLLSGPPGTGKTLIGRALTSELQGVTFAWVTPGGFDWPSDPGFFFHWARARTPAVLFFEDLDLIAGIRDSGYSGTSLGEILAQMDGFVANEGLVVLATTNDAEAIDQALRRPGRFDRQLAVALPGEPERRRMLTRFLASQPVEDRDGTVAMMATLTCGLAGAHLRELVDTVALHRATTDPSSDAPITGRDLEAALAILRSTRTDIGFTGQRDAA